MPSDFLSSNLSPAGSASASARNAGLFDGFAQDISYAFRQLRRSPGFAAVAILTLALGIGANTAIFTLVNSIMLTRLPVGHPEQLVLLHWMSHSKGPFVWNGSSSYGGCDMNDPGSGRNNCSFSYPVFEDFRSNAHSFQNIAAYAGGVGVQVDRNGHSTRANGQVVSGEFFSVLEVHPAYGRVLNPGDDQTGAPPALMLEFTYWQKQFGSDPAVVGGSVIMNGVSFNIVGVTPPEFFGISPGSRPNFWLPLHCKDVLSKPSPDRYAARSIWLYLIGRLKSGVSPDQARAETEVLFRASLANTATTVNAEPPRPGHPKAAADADLSIALTSAERGLANLRRRFSTQLALLMGVTGLVLLIACANIANLLLARASARRKEIAVRLALGASRARLLRQLLTESLLLGFLGAAAGLAVSYWSSRGIGFLLFRSSSPTLLAMFRPDFQVFGFAAAVAAVSATLFGLIPALTSTRVSPGATLKAAGGIAGGSGARGESGNRLGRILVAIEVAVALILVVGAGLFLRTLLNLETLNPGFQTRNLLTFSISPSAAKIPDDKSFSLTQELERRLAALPGVQAVTWSSDLMLVGNLWTTGVKIDEHPELGDDMETQAISVGPEFFETERIPILAGRSITLADCRKDAFAIWVNKSFAARYLKNLNPLGLHLHNGDKSYGIVGVVGDTKFQDLRSEYSPAMFFPSAGGDIYFQLRTAANPLTLDAPIRNIFSSLAPNLPIQGMQSLQEGIDNNLATENAMARLSTGFGLLALILAAIGIYGVLAYSVARRTSEIAIRMSLGAMPGNILKLVLGEGLRPAILGAVAGLLGSWALTRVVAQFLYGIKPLDAVTFLAATFTLLLIAALACYIPARRAMRVQPMIALRYE
ncbi:MAG TPA: ABC transporter permease [Candidatus Acidoferrales bacterium]|nr:ABC transporter permease [Candidatus Acidoferrales bacterium]